MIVDAYQHAQTDNFILVRAGIPLTEYVPAATQAKLGLRLARRNIDTRERGVIGLDRVDVESQINEKGFAMRGVIDLKNVGGLTK